jgi:hypothetical protein
MTSPLIATKLYIPKPRQGLFSRPALLKRLSEGPAGKLTLISASSGYGRTTLVVVRTFPNNSIFELKSGLKEKNSGIIFTKLVTRHWKQTFINT